MMEVMRNLARSERVLDFLSDSLYQSHRSFTLHETKVVQTARETDDQRLSVRGELINSRSLRAKVPITKVPKTRHNVLLLIHARINLCSDDPQLRESGSDGFDALRGSDQVDEHDSRCYY